MGLGDYLLYKNTERNFEVSNLSLIYNYHSDHFIFFNKYLGIYGWLNNIQSAQRTGV